MKPYKILLQIHQKENLNEYGNPEDFKIEDFMFSSLMKPGLGRICNYCNISKGKSMVFSSINQYAHHWYKNHKDFDFYTSSKDLARYFHLFRLGYEVKLEERQRQRSQYSGHTFTFTWPHKVPGCGSSRSSRKL